MCICILVPLYSRIQYHQFNTFTSAILSYKPIIYKSTNNPNQSIFLMMSPSTNTRSVSTASKKILSIVPHNSPISPYIKFWPWENSHWHKSLNRKTSFWYEIHEWQTSIWHERHERPHHWNYIWHEWPHLWYAWKFADISYNTYNQDE